MAEIRNSTLWQCPECGRSVNGFVNGCRCPSCRKEMPDACDCV
ncbi:hypothetical protein SAMN05216285_1946 [Natrinema salifodinae]|uniref:Uncharacterized protein n=1 Tax=Natrinema salifodinae TaxID=1202768 RepID=A0A1I0NNV8_9EURY|nr:hypothetical protein SAMN05216285_1946 [Natrinema salifodinae]